MAVEEVLASISKMIIFEQNSLPLLHFSHNRDYHCHDNHGSNNATHNAPHIPSRIT